MCSVCVCAVCVCVCRVCVCVFVLVCVWVGVRVFVCGPVCLVGVRALGRWAQRFMASRAGNTLDSGTFPSW